MNSERALIPIFNKIKMATVYHSVPWLSSQAKTFKGSLLASTLQIGKLRKDKIIRPVEIVPYSGRSWRQNTFYSLKPDSITNSHIEHQFGLIDVLMAFLYLYKDFELEIEYTPKLKAAGVIYRPDALVKMRSLDGREYHFLIEYERTRNPKAILEEKLLKNEQMPSFKSLGLSEHTKILYIVGHEWFNVFWRPLEYDRPEVVRGIDAMQSRFSNLLDIVNKSKKLPDHKYRFLPAHQFTRLNETVWITPKGNKVNLIS